VEESQIFDAHNRRARKIAGKKLRNKTADQPGKPLSTAEAGPRIAPRAQTSSTLKSGWRALCPKKCFFWSGFEAAHTHTPDGRHICM